MHFRPDRIKPDRIKKLAVSMLMVAGPVLIGPQQTQAAEGTISLAAGSFDLLGQHTDTMVQLEYAFAHEFWYGLQPLVGGWITFAEDNFLYAGLQRRFALTSHWWLTPSFAVGGYNDRNGKILGKDLEFQSRLELGYQFDERHGLSLQFGHISNGGLGHLNPGAEMLVLNYSYELED